jgi:hypothetical protein
LIESRQVLATLGARDTCILISLDDLPAIAAGDGFELKAPASVMSSTSRSSASLVCSRMPPSAAPRAAPASRCPRTGWVDCAVGAG